MLPRLPWFLLGFLVAVTALVAFFVPPLFANEPGYQLVGRFWLSAGSAVLPGLLVLWVFRGARALVDMPVVCLEVLPEGFVLRSRSGGSYRRGWSSSFLKLQLTEKNPNVVPKVEIPGLAGAIWQWGLPVTLITQDAREALLNAATAGGAIVKRVTDKRGSRTFILGGSRVARGGPPL